MKKLMLLCCAATAFALAACDQQSSQTAVATEPLTDYSHIAPAAAPIENGEYVCQRPSEDERLFTSQAVEEQIKRVSELLTNERLKWMFSNCFPNTLDTTVHYRKGEDGKGDFLR